jgi:peptide/nickel transport system substrate-binding protein
MHAIHRGRALGMAAGSLAVWMALSGCGRSHDESPGSSSSAATTAGPAATKDVDAITWNLPGGEPATLDPAKTYGGSDLLVVANICDSLLTLTPEGGVEPGLASSIDRPDDTTYVVHLRSTARFFDGAPVAADDVVFSLDRVRDPNSRSYWGFFAQHVENIVATDAMTVTISLSQPDAIFYQMLATPMAQIVQRAFVTEGGDEYGSPGGGVMCSGAYELASWVQGDRIVLKANEAWWNRDANPQHVKQVTFTFVTEDATITQALLNDDIDGSFNVPHTTLAQLQDADNGSVYMGPSTQQLVLVPTDLTGDSPLASRDLREALAASIDYDGILSSTLAGTAEPLRAIVPPGTWGTAREQYEAAYEELSVPAQDLERAKELIQASGVSDPTIRLAVPAAIPEYVSLGEAIQSNAEQAGFDVVLVPMPDADFFALYGSADARSKIDVFLSDYYADIPDPTELYMQIGIPGGAADFGGYDNPQVASQLSQARATSDDTQRAELTIEAQATITEDLVWLPLGYPKNTLFLNSRLGGATAAFPYMMYAPWLAPIGGV